MQRWLAAYNFAAMLTGAFMSIVRLTEDIFLQQAKALLYTFYGVGVEEKSHSKIEGTLLSFLNSSLNLELVHIILTTVSKNTVGTPKSNTNYKVYQDYDHTNVNHYVMDEITIENRQDWDVGTFEYTADVLERQRRYTKKEQIE